MAGFWGKRKREQQAELEAQDAGLARRAQQSLVTVDERVRVTTDELVFADAELGAEATAELRAALDAVRTHLREAFHLHQLNHDDIPDTLEEVRTRNARIVQLCEWAEELLDDRTSALEEDIARIRRAPEVLAKVKSDAAVLRERIPHAQDVVHRLQSRYATSALQQISNSAAEAEQLLSFAEHSADVSSRRRENGRTDEAGLALETATESVRRAAALIDGVEDFEIEALKAESTLADVVADSRGDLVAVKMVPKTASVTSAAAKLEEALVQLPAAGSAIDPFAELARLREANSALDAAVEKAQERAARPVPTPDQVRHALDEADRQIAVARSVISGHRGWIGADARTRLAEAERVRSDIAGSGASPRESDEDARERSLPLARRAAALATEALQLAQRDIDSSRPQDPGPPRGGHHGRGMGGGDMMTGLLGGALLGGLLGDMFD